MTSAEHTARKRTCEHCGRTWIAFGLAGERCVWCRPSVPADARQLAFEHAADDDQAPEDVRPWWAA